MQIGLFSVVFSQVSFTEMLKAAGQYQGIEALEIGCGGWPGSSHIDPAHLLASRDAAHEYAGKIRDAGFTLSALSCHGNPVHPDPTIAQKDAAIFENALRLAERLGVSTVVTFSGCPGGGPEDRTPNWITAPWPPEMQTALKWQWEERLIPYWKNAERRANDAGIRIALEAHPNFSVHNPETLLRLRAATGPALGINFDPSHLWWQGMDPVAAIAACSGAIHHVHAKDVSLNTRKVEVDGVLDAKPMEQINARSWTFRSVGFGHSELEWSRIVAALRLAGYDGVLSIEHEDALASIHEGLSAAVNLLSRVVLREPPVAPWWT
ncbi:MAG: TIM barrel protein [Acidobacteria bacterium]|nr:TIM barrel protein [Acidobacteriota bacterium]